MRHFQIRPLPEGWTEDQLQTEAKLGGHAPPPCQNDCARPRRLCCLNFSVVSRPLFNIALNYASTHCDTHSALFVFAFICSSAHSNSTPTILDGYATEIR